MFVDLETVTRETELCADVVIFGAGPAGITLAAELAHAPLQVLIVEAGGEGPAEDSSLSRELILAGDALPAMHLARARTFGGASTLWAGQVMPLDAVDFSARPWVEGSGWPFPRSVLQPYYGRAEGLLGLSPSTYEDASWPDGSPRPPALGPDLSFAFSRFTRKVDFGRAFGPAFRRSARQTVLLHATAVRVVLDSGRAHVDHVEVVSPGGNTARVRGRAYALCCGAVETARLLLASGVGTDGRDGERPVGRFFQEHMHLKLRLAPYDRRRAEAMFNSRLIGDHPSRRRVRAFPKIVASQSWQARNALLRVGADVCYSAERSPVVAGKVLARSLRSRPKDVPSAIVGLLGITPNVPGQVWRTLVRNTKPSEGIGDMYISVQCENAPSPANRVTLAEGEGGNGLRKAVLHWRVGEAEAETVTRFTDTLAQAFESAGIGYIERPLGWPLPSTELARAVDVGHHHMGTARMHDDPRQGVVDGNCRIHSVDNLYAGGAAVFPTGGYSNPTLTILALCIRLADLLRSRLA